MELLSVLGIIFTATVLAVVLAQYKKEYAVAVAVFAGIAVFLRLIFTVIEPIFEFRDIVLDLGVKGAYFSVALKTLGICLITGFVSDICNDFGQTALGNFATAAGKCSVFIMSLPILIELLGAALKFIG